MRALWGLLSPLPVVAVLAAVLLATPGLLAGVWEWPRAWVFLAAISWSDAASLASYSRWTRSRSLWAKAAAASAWR